mgnify:CR=1 FL=1
MQLELSQDEEQLLTQVVSQMGITVEKFVADAVRMRLMVITHERAQAEAST